MKNAALCFGSALLGACLVLWLQNGSTTLSAAVAQQGRNGAARSTDPESRSDTFRSQDSATAAAIEAISNIPAPRVYNQQGLAPDEAVAAYVYEVNDRSVANIGTRIGAARGLFGENPTEDSGSGFILDTEGHILTNNHVIESAQRILVRCTVAKNSMANWLVPTRSMTWPSCGSKHRRRFWCRFGLPILPN